MHVTENDGGVGVGGEKTAKELSCNSFTNACLKFRPDDYSVCLPLGTRYFYHFPTCDRKVGTARL